MKFDFFRFSILFSKFSNLYFRCRVVLKAILNMDMDLVVGVVMMCSELKDPDKLVHVGCHMVCAFYFPVPEIES